MFEKIQEVERRMENKLDTIERKVIAVNEAQTSLEQKMRNQQEQIKTVNVKTQQLEKVFRLLAGNLVQNDDFDDLHSMVEDVDKRLRRNNK